ncbi:preprotein translocase subunit SecA [Methylophilales bacterium MBRSG12]|uniref:Protein translocase subunit SecA n=1 Tax=Methylophilales bacterium MBRS-H7 TaxID=1623450 RepID=A0A0H4J1W7_9PROT|nr:preprotein translocase subunit SecA [Methylophilales bacterium MBRSF5]AKO66045.1 preprotein translocase subunit SecA [Methylophilales bacterium MBRS-H7]AKO67363.1 preprotein translocase subunit SecA [Methylophilales bacterium MBRSG12]
MLKKLINAVIGNSNQRLLKKYSSIVNKINELETDIQKLKDKDFIKKTSELKELYKKDGFSDNLMIEAFALVREASVRTLGLRHFDEQMIGGIALHNGKVAEMKTGEGKTLVATLPAYLNALTENGVHVITVNDYLARRDAEWMGKVYEFLGLTVGINQAQLPTEEKLKAYAADITYGTNNEFGFDYLRDNMVYSQDQKVQRGLNFALIDEVDSILIDEARTPLVISGQSDVDVNLYGKLDKIVPSLKRQDKEDGDGDYWIDEKTTGVILSESGHNNVEEVLTKLGVLEKNSNLYDPENISLLHYVQSALKAHNLFIKDKDYVVKDGAVVIIDEFTGRMMPGRRWSDGLHQAIEAKEKVKIQRESKTLAGITFQNYFRLYNKISGMTGTAETEAEEFKHIYNLETLVIPPHRQITRADLMDKIYRTSDERYKAVINDILDRNKKSQPILIGTTSIESSEFISKILNKHKLKHQVLNAKQHEKEAHIIEQAGKPGMITIATNMAGRGTDIVLGGNIDPEIERLSNESKKTEAVTKKIKALKDEWKKDHEVVLAAGGLHIIGTERHESRRIDNQLRGRSGRQGDPGSSCFYLSLEDSLMRIFASDRISSIMQKLNMPDNEPIEHSWVTRSIESAQKKVEGRNFEIRKQLLEFDEVPNSQRKVIYEQRNDVLNSDESEVMIKNILHESISNIVYEYIPLDSVEEMWDISGLENRLQLEYNLSINIKKWLDKEPNIEIEIIANKIVEQAQSDYFKKETIAGKESVRHFEKSIMLQIIDHHWRSHLTALDHLRQGVSMRAYGGKDPKQEFKREAFNMFEVLLSNIKNEIAKVVMLVEVKTEEQTKKIDQKNQQEVDKASMDSQNQDNQTNQQRKIGRNESCPCGSGKKYKHCHGVLS